MEIYICRNNEEFGPFSREAALEYVKQGVFQAGDRACYVGVEEWKTVGELLGISVSSRPGRGPDLTPNDKITEFNPTWAPVPEQPLEAPQPLNRRGSGGLWQTFMIALNTVLILIAIVVLAMRFAGGRELLERSVTALSGEFSRLENGVWGMVVSAPAPATPAPVFEETPVVAPAPSPTAAPLAGTPPPAPALSPGVPADSAAPAVAPAAVASPTAAPISTPPPPPKPFDPADLAGNPGAWPRTLTLKQAVVFPALYDGQNVGSITAPPGTAVNLVKIQGEELVLGFNGGTQTVPWRWTDIEEQAARRAPATPTLPGPAAGP